VTPPTIDFFFLKRTHFPLKSETQEPLGRQPDFSNVIEHEGETRALQSGVGEVDQCTERACVQAEEDSRLGRPPGSKRGRHSGVF